MRRAAILLACALGWAPARVAHAADVLILIERLQSDERWQTRSEAALSLGSSRDIRARRPLARAVEGDPHYGVRAAAIRALVQLGDARALPAVLDALADDEPFVRLEARRAIDRFELEAERPYLIHALRHHGDPRARLAAGERLAEIDDPEVIDAFLDVTGDPDPVGRYARSVITAQHGGRALSSWLSGLRHVDARVQIAAMEELVDLDAPEATEPIIELLDARVPEVTLTAAGALRSLGHHIDPRPFVVTARRSKDRFERARALKVVGAIGGEEAARVLLNAVEDPDVLVRGAAVAGLGILRDARAIPKLVEMKRREENARILMLVKNTLATLMRNQDERPALPSFDEPIEDERIP